MPDGGAKPDTSAGSAKGVSAQRLKSLIERIEKLEVERKALAADIKEVFSEAKSSGYDPKIMKKVIKIRSQDPNDRAEEESLIGVYLDAVGR